VIFAVPGIVLATVFVSLPLVVREVVPVLEEIGTDQEQAARSLGRQRLADVPAHHAAVDQVGGRLRRGAQPRPVARRVRRGQGRVGQRAGRDPTATLVVEEKYLNFDKGGAYAVAFLLTMVSGGVHRDRHDHPAQGATRRTGADEHRDRHVNKRFGDFVALDDVNSVTIPAGTSPRCSGPAAAASPPCCASSPGSTGPTRAVEIEGVDATTCRPSTATSASCSSTTRRSST
jgi:hypothetical protein